jgi:hypothetical protein
MGWMFAHSDRCATTRGKRARRAYNKLTRRRLAINEI